MKLQFENLHKLRIEKILEIRRCTNVRKYIEIRNTIRQPA
jgi:hypothetical protein